VAGNPRIDELRKKLDKEPGSRLFAQLAEELRKDGDLEDAIGVAREGLQKHPNYPSARMTLGRALFDTGDWPAARAEFELVLKGAPDNILASRLLAESLENLGDASGAVAQYKKTLALAPGDKQVLAHLDALEKGGASTGPAGAGAATAPGASRVVPAASRTPAARAGGVEEASRPPAAAPAPPAEAMAPIRLVAVDTPMELEQPHEHGVGFAPPASEAAAPSAVSARAEAPARADATGQPGEPAPIPLVAAEEDFELERPYEAPVGPGGTSAAHAATAAEARPAEASPPAPAPPPSDGAMMEFEFDAGASGGTIPFAPAPAPAPAPVPAAAPAPAEAPPSIPAPPVTAAAPAMHSPSPATPAPLPPMPPPASAAAAATREPAAPAPAAAPPEPISAPSPAAAPAREPEAAPPAAEPPAADLMSATLAELYFNQGFTVKAVEVYRQLLERDPGNGRLQRRLEELQKIAASPAPAAPAPSTTTAAERGVSADDSTPAGPATAGEAASATASRRIVLERTIARLEGMLAAIKKG
jgi:hypothetical protein